MMSNRRALFLVMAASLAAVASPAVASDNGAFSLKVANDGMISDDDGHYTSGVALGYSFAPDAGHWTQRLSRALPDGLIRRAEHAEYRLTHQIYTPDNIKTSTLIEDDRPYAGLVYGGVSLFGTEATAQGRVATDLHLDVGMVGPSSLADSLQQEVHRRLGNNRPEGWSHQLGDEAIVNLAVQRQWWQEIPLAGKQLAYGPAAGVALGNLNTYASVGYSVRFGDEARSVPNLSPHPASSAGFSAEDGWRWYLFAGTEGYYVAHNLLLDGNTFSSSHSVSRREWVGDVSAGLALGWNDWQMRFAAVQRTREFRGQDDPDKFAALTLGKRF